MKFFSELGSCFYGGGSTVTPAAEISLNSSWSSNTRPQHESGRRNSGGRSSHAGVAEGLRKVKSANTSRNWKPKLHMISEDIAVMPSDLSRAVGSDDKLSVKVKAKSKPKVPSATHGEDYWKSPSLWAIPAFSPTPFSF